MWGFSSDKADPWPSQALFSVIFKRRFSLEYNCFAMLGVFLPYNGAHQLCVHVCPLFLEPPAQPSRSSQGSALGSALCCRLSFVTCFAHGGVYTSALLSQSIPPSPSPLCPQVRSLGCLCCCPANRFIRTIFLVYCIYVTVHKR